MASFETAENVDVDDHEEFGVNEKIDNNMVVICLKENSEDSSDDIANHFDIMNQIGHHVQTVCGINDCLEYLSSNSDKSTFLLVFGGMPEDVLRRILDFRHIANIYVLKRDAIATGKHHKLNFVDTRSLINQLQHDIKQHFNTPMLSGSLEIHYKSQVLHRLRSSSQEFLFHQLLIEILFRLPMQLTSRSDFISHCRTSFAENDIYMSVIRKFDETYQPNQALSWYTRPTFIFRIINQICQRGSILLMLKIRFFLCDLYKQLREIHNRSRVCFPPILCVFRGMIMHIDKFKEFEANIGKLIITKSFLSTTIDRRVANVYAGYGDSVHPYVSVIFQISIDTTLDESKPFGFVGEHGAIPDEREVILSIGTIFRQHEIRQLSDNAYEVLWSRSSHEKALEQEILNCYLRDQTGECNIFFQTARFLQATKNHTEVSQYCRLISENLSPSDQNIRERLCAWMHESDTEISRLIAYPSTRSIRTHITIWLDFIIGSSDAYISLKQMFRRTTSLKSQPEYDAHDMIHASYWINFQDVAEPIIAVTNIDQCLELLELYANHKKVFLIASGTLGRYLVPRVVSHYPMIHSIYIFCHGMTHHIHWAQEFVNVLQMFDNETDLLCRLTRDISRYYTTIGRDFICVSDHASALGCFQLARTLRHRAEFLDPDSPTRTYGRQCIKELDMLIGTLLETTAP